MQFFFHGLVLQKHRFMRKCEGVRETDLFSMRKIIGHGQGEFDMNNVLLFANGNVKAYFCNMLLGGPKLCVSNLLIARPVPNQHGDDGDFNI